MIRGQSEQDRWSVLAPPGGQSGVSPETWGSVSMLALPVSWSRCVSSVFVDRCELSSCNLNQHGFISSPVAMGCDDQAAVAVTGDQVCRSAAATALIPPPTAAKQQT